MNIGYMICETPTTTSDIKIITQKGNRVVAEVVLQETEEQNRNGRNYGNKDLIPQLTCARSTELLSTGNMKGENGHPMSKEITRQQTIDPDLVCVKYLKWWADGNLIKAHCKGTNGQRGQDFNDDLLDGELPSFSLRALGTIEQTGGKAWVKNIKIITYDRVIYPSHKRAYTEKLVSESGSLITAATGNRVVMSENANENGLLIPITNDAVISYIKQESCNINTILNNFDTLYESMTLIDNGRNVQLMDRSGGLMIVHLETYVGNEIMNYCYKK